MKAVVAAFNQEKALVGAFSVITNLRMELFEALVATPGARTAAGGHTHQPPHHSAPLPPSYLSLSPGHVRPRDVRLCDAVSRVTRVTTPAPPVSGPGSAAIAISCCHGTGSILPRMRTAHHSALSRNVAGNLHLSPNIYISIHSIHSLSSSKPCHHHN